MTLAFAFLVTFIVGPALFRLLVQRPVSHPYRIVLWSLFVTFSGAAIVSWRVLATHPDESAYMGLATLLALWLAWIVVLALCLLAIRPRAIPYGLDRAAFAIGTMATTLPWFGLYTAEMVLG